LFVDGDRVYSPSGRSSNVVATTEIDFSTKKPVVKPVEMQQTKIRDHIFYAPSAVFGNVLLTTEHLVHAIETNTVHIPDPPFKGIVPDDLLEKHNAAVAKLLSLGGKRLWSDHMIIRLPTGQRVPGMIVAFDVDWKGSDADLALLKDIYRVGQVFFHRAAVGDEGFAHLYDISTINELYIMDTPISEAAIQKFPLRQLTALHLEDVSTPPRYSDKIIIESLGDATNLANLFLAGKGFTDRSREHLQRMPRRPQLQVFNTSMSP